LDRHHPGDSPEEELGRALMLELEQRAGLPVRVGIAASKLAPRVAAGQPHSPTVVAAGEEAAFLAPLPLARLTPQAKTLSTLEHWGIRSAGELARLPRAEVISRLGADGQELQAIAGGIDPQPLVPRQPPPSFGEGMELEWPLVNLEPFLFAARAALERLTQRMAGHGLACERLELSLELEPDGYHERSITLPAPTREVKTLLTLLRLDLESQQPGAPIVAFQLTAHPDRPRREQLSLFGPAALSPDKLATTLARLFAMLGEERVGSPRTVDAHRPERFALEPFTPPPPPRVRRPPRPGRGLLTVRVLRPPLELEVLTGGPVPAGREPDNGHPDAERPVSLKTVEREENAKKPRIAGKVRVASGPWGIEEDWWAEKSTERDYWDVELANGGLYRVFRERTSREWFVDGVYD
ncbi:MAG: hypothetical protein GY856_46640, partial [bacterium]|nr:hypothetical protein [bacterium]